MTSRITLLVAGAALAVWALPMTAAQYEKTGDWVFNSKAVAAADDAMLLACVASTEGVEGTELSLGFEPAADGGFEARLTLSNETWELDGGPVRVRFDIGADHWVLPGQGEGRSVDVVWTGDAAFLTFLEDLASSSFAGLKGRDGTALAQFSLRGSRSTIEAMKLCAEEQIGQPLGDVFAPATGTTGSNPF